MSAWRPKAESDAKLSRVWRAALTMASVACIAQNFIALDITQGAVVMKCAGLTPS